MNISTIEESQESVRRLSISLAARDTRPNYQKKLAEYLILTSVLFERMAFYSLASNLVLYLQSARLQWNSKDSALAVYMYYGTTYISTLIFAVISDAKLGRGKTIIFGFIMYLLGYILFTIIVKVSLSSYTIPVPAIIGILIFIAIGAGAVQSNMAVFGAEQSPELKKTWRYFDKYMIAINLGNIIARSAIPYIQNPTVGHYFAGYLIATFMLFVAALLFIIGLRYYKHVEPYDSVIVNCIPVLINAFQTWRQYKTNQRFISLEHMTSSSSSSSSSNVPDRASYPLPGQRDAIEIDERPSTFLDFAKLINHGKFHEGIVDDVKSLRAALIVFILLIPYCLIYNQPDTTFALQGNQMNTHSVRYAIIWMALADPLVIIIGILIFNTFVYKHLNSENPLMEIGAKLVIGMCFASITMCITGVVEGFRQNSCNPNLGMNASNLSIYYQLPEYIGMGVSEFFVTLAYYEFAYYAAPRSAQSLFMSLRFYSVGVSSMIGSAYIYLFPTISFQLDFSCQSDRKLQWSFYVYFFNLAILQLIFIIIFILCQKKFQIIKIHPEKLQSSQFL